MPEPTPADQSNAARKSGPAGAPDTHSNKQTGPAGSLNPGAKGNATPDRIGRFTIKKLLGEGAFARVYLGVDPELEREVAIKVPKVEELTPEFRDAFLRENRLAAIIQHPNICPVYEVGQDGGFPYIVMRVVPSTLAALLKRLPTPMPPKSAAAVARKLALGLTAAHAQKVIHRDLKPANVLYDEANREVLIADFGLARFADQATDASNGVPKGTPAYMAPEQARGQADKIGPLSDVYSLGVMLYELLTGSVPFKGSIWEVMRDHCETTPPPPSHVRLGVDHELDVIVAKAMAKHPADRYPSAKALAQALGDYLIAAERGGGSLPLFNVSAPEVEVKPKQPNGPSFEVVAPKPAPKPAPPKPQKPVAVTVEEDDEEEEEQTEKKTKRSDSEKKRKPKRKEKKGVPVAVWAGAGVGVLVVVIVAVVLIAGKKKPEPVAASPNTNTNQNPVTPPPEPKKVETPEEVAKRRERAEADLKTGQDYYSGSNGKPKDLVKAREYYESSAALGDTTAQFNLAVMYANGRGVVKDDAKAREWYEKAASQGHMIAQNNLGVLYFEGRGGPVDFVKAREWYEKAANQGQITAQNNLGLLYEAGQGTVPDYSKARWWYEKAAAQGSAAAQTNMGNLYYAGRGVGSQDFVKAREWYEKAAAQNYALAQYYLGRAYEYGRGAFRDTVQALVWYRKAAAQGNEDARKAVERLEKGK